MSLGANQLANAEVPAAAGGLRVPRHVAIIMDGNGRWARRHGLPRTAGHQQGVEAVRKAVAAALEAGIDYLTLYSFSSENWSRPKEEVGYLLNLLRRFADQDVALLHERGVRIRVIGERDTLQRDIVELIEEAEARTRDNTAMTLVIAFNYGARDEIARAVREIAVAIAGGALAPEAVTPELVAAHLYTRDIPDPDLIIRTSGEQRLSNFLLWQSAYAEFVFVDAHWPEFDKTHLMSAIQEFSRRERRFGGVSESAL